MSAAACGRSCINGSATWMHTVGQFVAVLMTAVGCYYKLQLSSARLTQSDVSAVDPKWWGLIDYYGSDSEYLHFYRFLNNRRQRSMLKEEKNLMFVFAKALRAARSMCSWVSSESCEPKYGRVFGTFTAKGLTKETAMMHALTTVTALRQVALACKEGLLSGCSCDPDKYGRVQAGELGHANWECSVDTRFSLKKVNRFISAEPKICRSTITSRVRRHNDRVGRQRFKRSTKQRHCVCNGVSASCQMKSCWTRLGNLQTITENLYQHMVKLAITLPMNNNLPKLASHKDIRLGVSKDRLVYIDDSCLNPGTFCKYDRCHIECCSRQYVQQRVNERHCSVDHPCYLRQKHPRYDLTCNERCFLVSVRRYLCIKGY